MKTRLPRKLKKSIYTKARLFDKSLGIRCRRSVMLLYVRHLYLERLHGIRFLYDSPYTLEQLSTFEKLRSIFNRYYYV